MATKKEILSRKVGTTDAHAAAVGKFYRISGEYAEKFKIGGYQKLQKLVGEDMFYQGRGKTWWWANPVIIRMTTAELNKVNKKIESAKTPMRK